MNVVPPPPSNVVSASAPPLKSGLKRRSILQSRINERPSAASHMRRPVFEGRKVNQSNETNDEGAGVHDVITPFSGGEWWVSGLPCLLIVLAYGGTPSLLCGAIGTIAWHVLDLAGPDWGGFALAAWWLALFTVAVTICAASDEILMHSFGLILLPSALLMWLMLLGVWGTLQYKWIADDSMALVEFLSEIMCTLTPLIAPAVITWGCLALQLVDVGQASLVLALSSHFLVRTSVFSNQTRLNIGNGEFKIVAFTSFLLPILVHSAVHYHMLVGPSSSALSAFLAITEGSLDQARSDILWELAILGSGGLLSLLKFESEARKRKGSLWTRAARTRDLRSEAEHFDGTFNSLLADWSSFSSGGLATLVSWMLLIYAVEARLLVYLQPYFEVWWGSLGLYVALLFAVAGFVIWYQLEDEEKSIWALHALTAVATFIVTHVFGVAWLLRPMCIAACMSLCEFLSSQQLVWFLVAAITLGFSFRSWCHSKIGFLSESAPLPHVDWLPYLGGEVAAPLSRLLFCVVLLAVVSVVLPAAVWSDQDRVLVSLGLTCHHILLLLVETLLCHLDEPYPLTFLCLTATAHVALAWRLYYVGSATGWSRWSATSIAVAKVTTLSGYTPLKEPSLFYTVIFFLVLSTPWLHPSRQSIARLNLSNSENIIPLAASTGMFMTALTCLVSVWCMPTTIYPMASALLDSPLSSIRAATTSLIISFVFIAILLALHFPHRLRLRKLSTAGTAIAMMLFYLNPRAVALTSSSLLQNFEHAPSWSLAFAVMLSVMVLFGVIPLRRLGSSGRTLLGAIVGASFGSWVSSTFPSPSVPISVVTSLYTSFLFATTSLISTNYYGVSVAGAGPLFCSTLCCAVAIWVLSEVLGHFPNPQQHMAQQRSLMSAFAIANIFLAMMMRLGPLNRVNQKPRKDRATKDDDNFTELFVGNGATVVSWAAAVYYTYLVRETAPDSLRSLLIELPLSFLLTLLRDDGGILLGLDVHNRFTIPYTVCLLKLAFMPLYALLLRGAPFFVTSSFAASAKQAAPLLKGVDIARISKARALRELSFWTASSINTPLLELVLLFATLPVHLTMINYLWNKRQIFSFSTNLLFLPLNLVALVMVR